MNPREENEVLAQWAGFECRCIHATCRATNELTCYWGGCPRHHNNGLPPDYDRDEVASSLVLALRAKGYSGSMFYNADGYEFRAYHPKYEGMVWCSGTKEPTIAAAIKAAVLQLIEKEKP